MPFDGSGNFNRALGPTTWQNDAAAGIKIKANLHDNNDNDIAGGLSNVICKDGQSSPTADITLNGHKLINVANPTNPQDAMTLNSFAAAAVRYDTGQALSIAQQLIAHTNLAATKSVLNVAGAYSLLQADRGKLLRVTGALTLTLPAASAVGNDFSVDFRTMGGAMTLDPAGTNQIEGANADCVVADNGSGTLWSDGTAWWVSRTGAMSDRIVSVTETWTKPAALKFLEVWGQAGGGGGQPNQTCVAGEMSAGSGGGGGGAFYKLYPAADLPATVLITIPANAVAGAAGGTLTFGALMSATGGGVGGVIGNGSTATIVNGGAGGVGTGGTLSLKGGSGSPMFRLSGAVGRAGDGGNAPFGDPGALAATVSAAGGTGTLGGGGSGAIRVGAGGVLAGGAGGQAYVRMREIY